MKYKKITRALISVSNKEGVASLAQELAKNGVEIIASDGTAALLKASGIEVKTVTEVTGSPELLEGKVKTLHPLIHAAILVDQNNPAQIAEIKGVGPIDLLIINLYPTSGFDIGGPALTRAAAKNCEHVAVITAPDQYSELLESLEMGTTLQQREKWAVSALLLTAKYDLALLKERSKPLRYGENPHQDGAIATTFEHEVLQGKAMSFNNYLDLQAAWEISRSCGSAVAIVKHGIPSGVAQAETATNGFNSAWACDPVSAFGGVVVSDLVIDAECASEIVKRFVEVVAAAEITKEAQEIFATKPNLRVVKLAKPDRGDFALREIDGGFLFQTQDSFDNAGDKFENWKLVSGIAVDESTAADLELAWRIAGNSRSNAVVLVKDRAAIGIGAGSVSRVDAAGLAISKANEFNKAKILGSVAASDGFFPFPDGVEALIASGVRVIVQPGGSVKDDAVIAAAQSAGISMYLTGQRHFSH
ncbi:MAG: bifunctional phosphoribosylaminoimidazolecarboxamide formyltransferase/IMP cyclohydrolase [Candidatus Nanopelagicaceae bacterium]|nr:bifunctional phosphoribosylaminoimidazolecarboxamide formyltransferase/IMP cyclohydrolase [Candidatus Nanopelagicaceae bacterium]